MFMIAASQQERKKKSISKLEGKKWKKIYFELGDGSGSSSKSRKATAKYWKK